MLLQALHVGIEKKNLNQWFLTCGEFPTGGNGRVAKWGMTGRTAEPLLQNLTHHMQMLTYKPQPFVENGELAH